MNNKYILIPSLDLDIEQIKDIVKRNINIRVPGLASHHRLIKNEPYLEKLKEKYYFLSSVYNIYNTQWDYTTPVHIDSNRYCALNIPIENVKGSYTVYYELNDELISDLVPSRAYSIVESEKIEKFRFTLEKPTIINTKIPHNIIHNTTKSNRIIMSWSVNENYTFDDVKKILVSML
jgi:hypothetical protein